MTDRSELGPRAVWLPTPVTDRLNTARRLRCADSRLSVYGMIANFDYPPNRDAYRHLVAEWLPVLAQNCDRIVVAGFGSQSLPRSPGIDILGPLESVASFYAGVDAALAPMERGGGMKVKVVEAMMYGVPVVATEHSTEGLPPAISGACIRWGMPLENLRDPRDDAAVADELRSFTFRSFQRQFDQLWDERMTCGNTTADGRCP
jgi:glycosyltransferase involved in cell wall biosynthesis